MDRRSENRYTMYKVVYDWLVNNREQLEAIPGFGSIIDEFGKLLQIIAGLDQSKTNGTAGITITKAQARARVEKMIMEIGRIMKVHASFNNDQVLLNDVDFTNTQLSRSSEQALLARAHKLLGNAQNVQPATEGYGMTPERVGAFETAITDFETKQTTVRSAIVERKDAGEQLEARMEELDELLKGKVDLLMELVQNSNPELYNVYKGTRVIVDR